MFGSDYVFFFIDFFWRNFDVVLYGCGGGFGSCSGVFWLLCLFDNDFFLIIFV